MEIVEIEQKGYSLRVYGNKVYGCQNHEKDVMITFPTPAGINKDGVDFIDVFLTTEQAINLSKQLEDIITQQTTI